MAALVPCNEEEPSRVLGWSANADQPGRTRPASSGTRLIPVSTMAMSTAPEPRVVGQASSSRNWRAPHQAVQPGSVGMNDASSTSTSGSTVVAPALSAASAASSTFSGLVVITPNSGVRRARSTSGSWAAISAAPGSSTTRRTSSEVVCVASWSSAEAVGPSGVNGRSAASAVATPTAASHAGRRLMRSPGVRSMAMSMVAGGWVAEVGCRSSQRWAPRVVHRGRTSPVPAVGSVNSARRRSGSMAETRLGGWPRGRAAGAHTPSAGVVRR